MYQRKDYYFNKAKKEGFRARSCYKLIEILKKYTLLKNNDAVLDIGCAPGSWLQVLRRKTKGEITGIDTQSIKPLERITFLKGDIEDPKLLQQITNKYDLILSDIAPKTTGIKERDQAVSFSLSKASFLFAKKILKRNGNFLVKTFQSKETQALVKKIKPFFDCVKIYIPKSTRHGSKEIYIIAKGYKGETKT